MEERKKILWRVGNGVVFVRTWVQRVGEVGVPLAVTPAV
jgi:hypothetical protein